MGDLGQCRASLLLGLLASFAFVRSLPTGALEIGHCRLGLAVGLCSGSLLCLTAQQGLPLLLSALSCRTLCLEPVVSLVPLRPNSTGSAYTVNAIHIADCCID